MIEKALQANPNRVRTSSRRAAAGAIFSGLMKIAAPALRRALPYAYAFTLAAGACLVAVGCSSDDPGPASPGTDSTSATTTSPATMGATSSSTSGVGVTGAGVTSVGGVGTTSSASGSGGGSTSVTAGSTTTGGVGGSTSVGGAGGVATTGDGTTTVSGAGGMGGSSGSGGSTGMGGSGGGTGEACPATATFCSGFESAELPEGAVYNRNGAPSEWTVDFEVDSSVKHSGNSSLRVRSESENTGSAYKMLAVPAPGAAFWARFYLRSDVELGSEKHNVFAEAADGTGTNATDFVEFAEDVGIAFNSNDAVRWPDGYGRLMSGETMPYALAADTWYCIELSFDGQNRVQMLVVDGTQLINATDFPTATKAFTTFKFGYNALNGGVRNTWYDDVAVAPERIGCL